MIIDKVSVINWMGHKSKELDLSAGRNLIFGRNASGKSSLAKAIAFNLTGYPPKNVDPRRLSKSEAIVSLNITANDNKKYLIRRQVNTAKKISNSLFIYDGKNPSEALYTGDRAEEFLKELTGLSSDIFERVIYMKEEDVYEFLSKPDSGVMREIDSLIGLEKARKLSQEINDMSHDLKIIQKQIEKDRKEITTAVNRELGLSESKADIKLAKKRKEAIPIETGELLELKEHYENQEKLMSQITDMKKSVEVSNPKEIEAKLISLQLSVEQGKKTTEKIIRDNNEKLEKMRLEQSTIVAKSDLKDKIVEELEKSDVTECPTCGRPMDKKTVNDVLKKLKSELNELDKALKKQIDVITNLKDETKKKEGEVNELERRVDGVKVLKESIGGILANLSTTEEGIKQLQKKGYPKSIAEITKKLDELDAEEQEMIETIGKAKGAEEVTTIMVQKRAQEEEDVKHKTKILELIVKAIEQTTNKLRESYSAEVKNQAEAIWSAYKGEKWLIEWDDNFVPKAKPANGERELSAYEMSGSERFLILLAIRIAIQKSLEQFNLLIIDEPCQHLDEANGRAFRDILTNIAEDKIKQSIIFTYNEDFLEGDWSKIHKLS